MMDASINLTFKKKKTDGPIFKRLYKVAGSPRSICVEAENGLDFMDCDLLFDINALKELSLLLNEFLFFGEDIDVKKRMKSDSEKSVPKARVSYLYLDLLGDNISMTFDDSKDLETGSGLFVMQINDKESLSLSLSANQAQKISKALKRFALAYDLIEKVHQKETIPAPNPA